MSCHIIVDRTKQKFDLTLQLGYTCIIMYSITIQRTFKLHLVLILAGYPNHQGTMKTLLQWQQLLLKYMYILGCDVSDRFT